MCGRAGGTVIEQSFDCRCNGSKSSGGGWSPAPLGAMTALVWNYRGLEAVSTVRKLRKYVSEMRPIIMFLSEMKCGQSIFERVREWLDMFVIGVPSKVKSGGLALCGIQE
ncbi:UNVERIFIED_CONTAM: hypothetical protein Sradi_3833300 [Sesamum radiatum]|uniref:Uncharacterized protein n=1 Tax=Sesamum radiatum TaxID=300843 RepID=A0AAW2Q153_SESRA